MLPQKIRSGFTLFELLVVIAFISAFSFVVVGGLRGAGRSVALQSGQESLSNLVTAARLRAVSTGRRTRLVLPVDPVDSSRFLRVIALQIVHESSASPWVWNTVHQVEMPEGVYVSPRDPSTFSGLLATGFDWRRRPPSGVIMGSTLFSGGRLVIDLQDGRGPVTCEGISFTERGTIAGIDGSGSPLGSAFPLAIVMLPGRRLNPGQQEIPVVLETPEAARGVFVSLHGVPTLIYARASL